MKLTTKKIQRSSGRKADEMRNITFKKDFVANAQGSCLVSFGNTQVICTATIDEKVPRFLRNTGSGWVTAEYSMLPSATHERCQREAARGKQTGRTQEIQRLIGRALRQAVDLKRLGERQIVVDCDVINADGGTRTASICGGFVAMFLALAAHPKLSQSNKFPIQKYIAAISCGLIDGAAVVDLDYAEDSNAITDANFVMDHKGGLIEVQSTGEEGTFSHGELFEMLTLANSAAKNIIEIQKECLGAHNLGKKYKI